MNYYFCRRNRRKLAPHQQRLCLTQRSNQAGYVSLLRQLNWLHCLPLLNIPTLVYVILYNIFLQAESKATNPPPAKMPPSSGAQPCRVWVFNILEINFFVVIYLYYFPFASTFDVKALTMVEIIEGLFISARSTCKLIFSVAAILETLFADVFIIIKASTHHRTASTS